MFSPFLSLSLALSAFAAQSPTPDDCKNVAAYQASLQAFGVANAHLKMCSDNVAAMRAAMADWKAANQKSRRAATLSADGTQAAALGNTAALAGAGAATDQGFAQAAANSKDKFDAITSSANSQIKRLDMETSRILSLDAVSASQKEQFRGVSLAARKDLAAVAAGSQQLSAGADKFSAQFRSNAQDFQMYQTENRRTAERLNGGAQDDPNARPPAPAAAQSSSNNVLIGLGGAALITAGAVGGLYWVSQKAIKSANDDASLRIAQAQAAANNVIANAGSTATAVITAAQTAAQNIIQFATNSVNQIISNAAAAANAIYDKAKADIATLKTELTNEINDEFQYLTTAGLAKLEDELGTMFSGLIARAQAEGNAALASSLQSTLDQLKAQVDSEITRRGSSTATASGTTSATATSSSTATSTNGTITTSTAITTEVSTGTLTR